MATFLPTSEDITIYRGDDVKIAFLFTDNGVARDLTDWDDFIMNVRRSSDKAKVNTSVLITNNNAAVTGQLIANIEANDFSQTNMSSVGDYELRGVYTNPSDTTDVRTQTLSIGAFNITDDIK